jgi:hypothetical protein
LQQVPQQPLLHAWAAKIAATTHAACLWNVLMLHAAHTCIGMTRRIRMSTG